MIKKVKAPCSYDGYITKDKEYEVLHHFDKRNEYEILSDDGFSIFIRLVNCSHLGGKDWIVV